MRFATTSYRPLLVVGITALVIAGCGGSGDDGSAQTDSGPEIGATSAPETTGAGADRSTVRGAVTAYYDAMANGDVPYLCSGMTERARQSAEQSQGKGQSCEKALAGFRGLAKATPDSEKIKGKVMRVDSTGDVAIATIALGGGNETQTRLVREDGSWLLDGPAKQ